eukprot:6470097-Pyramimonas_sp.AAC.1
MRSTRNPGYSPTSACIERVVAELERVGEGSAPISFPGYPIPGSRPSSASSRVLCSGFGVPSVARLLGLR